jgi:hypothetical protein
VAAKRPPIPRALARQVLVEAGHRCAIPTCRQTPVELHHIEPWSKVKEHTFENLIALCPTDHARATNGKIDRKAVRMYKQNLGVLNSRYGEAERRLLDTLAKESANAIILAIERDFDFYYLMQDGLLVRQPAQTNSLAMINGVQQGPWAYVSDRRTPLNDEGPPASQGDPSLLKPFREDKARMNDGNYRALRGGKTAMTERFFGSRKPSAKCTRGWRASMTHRKQFPVGPEEFRLERLSACSQSRFRTGMKPSRNLGEIRHGYSQ